MKYILQQENLSIKPFRQYLAEEISGDEDGRKSELNRSSVENMMKPYGQDSETSARLRSVAKKRGIITTQYSVAYPCYRNALGGDSFVFYDSETGRTFEMFKAEGHPEWRGRFGEKGAEEDDEINQNVKTFASTLKGEYTSIYKLWFESALIDLQTKKLHVTSAEYTANSVHQAVLIALTKMIAQLRSADLSKSRKTAFPIKNAEGESLTRAMGAEGGVKTDVMNKTEFEKSAGSSGYTEWYRKAIGGLATAGGKEKEKKASKVFGNKKIAEMIKDMGLIDEEYSKNYNNVELLRMLNAIIQDNPHAPLSTKKAWREVLAKIYQEYNVLSTKDLESANEDYYGPMLYDETKEKHILNATHRPAFRFDLWSLMTSIVLKGEDLGSPDTKMYNRGPANDEYGVRYSAGKITKRERLKEGLIPTFTDFLFEGKGVETYYVSFSGPVTEEEMMGANGIKGAASVKRIEGRNRWEITGGEGVRITDGIEDFAFSHDPQLDILSIEEPNASSKSADAEQAYRTKRAEELNKAKAAGYSGHSTGAASNREKTWMQKASKKFKGGRYIMDADNRKIREVIFDAIDTLGGYLDVTLDKEGNKYYARIIPDESFIQDFIPSRVKNLFVIKTDAGYLAYGLPAGSNKQKYYSTPNIAKKDVMRFNSEDEANKQIDKIEGAALKTASYAEELKASYTEKYYAVLKKYDSPDISRNAFYIDGGEDENNAEKARSEGHGAARSTNEMDSNLRYSFLEAVAGALFNEKAQAAGEKAAVKVEKSALKTDIMKNEYESVESKSPELAAELKDYGTNPGTVYSSTVLDYLLKTAELINKMKGLGMDEIDIMQLAETWASLANSALGLVGRELKHTATHDKIEQAQIDQVEKDLANDDELRDDKIQYMLNMAFLQMLVRDIGAAHISHASTGGRYTPADESPTGYTEAHVGTEYVAKTPLPDLWESYMKALAEEQAKNKDNDTGDVLPDDGITDARKRLMSITIDAMRNAEPPEGEEDAYEMHVDEIEDADPRYDLLGEEYGAVKDSLSLLGAKAAAVYKAKMRDAVYDLFKQNA